MILYVKGFFYLLTISLLVFSPFSRPPVQFKNQLSCEDCGKLFADNKQMELHSKKIHGDKDFVCDICNNGYRTQSILDNHMEFQHQKQTMHICNECGKPYNKELNLKRHKKNHQFNHQNCKTYNPQSTFIKVGMY